MVKRKNSFCAANDKLDVDAEDDDNDDAGDGYNHNKNIIFFPENIFFFYIYGFTYLGLVE